MPAQVPIETRNISKGDGALAVGGWSVGTMNLSKWASTREPPGKSMSISMLFKLLFKLLLGVRYLKYSFVQVGNTLDARNYDKGIIHPDEFHVRS